MKETINGWVVVNYKHPNNTGHKFLDITSFAHSRKDSIEKFIKGSGRDWRYWYRRFNFRCVKAEVNISTID